MEAPFLFGHVAVSLQNYVLVFAGAFIEEDAGCNDVMRFIWSYNLYTERWRKYRIPESKSTPHMDAYASAVAIGTDVYMFGLSNSVWQLTINKNRCFTWTKMPEKAKSETPSPRQFHSAWEYLGKMWIFGGSGTSPSCGFLNEHGDKHKQGIESCNNQLLCYDPCCNTWTNPKCFGDVPCPRARHATAIIRNKVFLYGGSGQYGGYQTCSYDFCMMNMDSLSWTTINKNQPNPGHRVELSLTAVTANQLALVGGVRALGDDSTWIFDIENGMWKEYTQFKDHLCRYLHTGTRGLTSSVFIIGGLSRGTPKENTSLLLLEPKSLQQLAMYIIYQHMDMLPWQSLPSKIRNKIMDPAQDEEPDY